MRRHAPGFPGRGRMPPAVFLPSPPPQGGGRAFSVQKRGTSRGLPAIRWPPAGGPASFLPEKGRRWGCPPSVGPPEGGQPLSVQKGDGDGGARHPLAPRRGASLFPFGKGTAMGGPPSVGPPEGGPASFLLEKGRRWGCRGCCGRGPSTPQQASPSFRRRWRSSRAPAPKVNRVPRVRIFATPGPPVLGSTAPVVLVQVTAFSSLRVKRTEFSLS